MKKWERWECELGEKRVGTMSRGQELSGKLVKKWERWEWELGEKRVGTMRVGGRN